MKKTLYRQFFANYLLVLTLSLVAGFCVLVLLSFADSLVSKSLIKNQYPASSLMKDDYAGIETDEVVENGGGIQIIDSRYRVVRSEGLNNFDDQAMTKGEFTQFLLDSQRIGVRYHYDVLYNEQGDFWLVVTFPTSVRLDLAIAINQEAAADEMRTVTMILGGALLLYLLLLAGFSVFLSKITALGIIRPLRKLTEGARLLREGDYSARVDLRLTNEFAMLQDTFNDMAERIETEIALRKRSESDRRQLILDISHDLKNPLASVAGYAELCIAKPDLPAEERNKYLQVIQNNSLRANKLLLELFELSKLDSPAFSLKKIDTDICEYLRQMGSELIPLLEKEGMTYEFDIPEEPVMASIDTELMGRVFHNLTDNAIRYSGSGTMVTLKLAVESGQVDITFSDNGPGMEEELSEVIFKPFIRRDLSRNPETGGSGLGLSIVEKIIKAHNGTITLRCAKGEGCRFHIRLPLVQ
jgi:signal transduction histidine kinase